MLHTKKYVKIHLTGCEYDSTKFDTINTYLNINLLSVEKVAFARYLCQNYCNYWDEKKESILQNLPP